MANFCTKCGAGLSPDTKFCTSCGAPAGAAAAAPPPAGFAPVNVNAPGAYTPPASMPAPVYGAPVQRSGGALKIVLIVVGVVLAIGLIIGMLGMFAAWRISRAVHVSGNGEGVTLNTPGGTLTAGKSAKNLTETEVGAPIYPGSAANEGGLNIKTSGGSMSTTVFTTSDSPEQVIAFYKEKLGTEASVVESSDGAVLTAGHSDSEGVMVTVSRDSSSGKTQITVTHTKNLKGS